MLLNKAEQNNDYIEYELFIDGDPHVVMIKGTSNESVSEAIIKHVKNEANKSRGE